MEIYNENICIEKVIKKKSVQGITYNLFTEQQKTY